MEVFLARALAVLVATATIAGGGTPSGDSAQSASAARGPSNHAKKQRREVRRLQRRQRARDGRPNVVLILTDDLSWNLVRFMPNVLQMRREGMTFTNYFVTDSLCCPSRASILSGRYPHNHGVLDNNGPSGGFRAFRRGVEGLTFATALENAGYRTSLMGKYFNGYHTPSGYVPPGWTDWDGAGAGYKGYNYTLSANGRMAHFGRARRAYITDVLRRRGKRFIRRSARGASPFLIEVSTFAPHKPYVPAARHRHMFPGQRAPRDAAYNARVVNPPSWLRNRPPLDIWQQFQLDDGFRRRAQSVQAVDELIGQVRRMLRRRHLMRNTYLIFSSDNGYHMGQRRLMAGKQTPYDSDTRVPLVVVGPGVPPGSTNDELTENVDLAPTFMSLGNARMPTGVDGHSLVELFHGRTPRRWRNAVLIEHHHPASPLGDPDAQTRRSGNPPTYSALRTKRELYVEYVTGEREWYDLTTDPDQLHNRYDELGPFDRQALHQRLAELESCSGNGCRRATTSWVGRRARLG